MIMRSIFTQASVQLHFLCFCFHSVFLFSFLFCFVLFWFCFGFLHHCHCKTSPLQEDIITLTSGVTCHYIVLHPVSSRASRTSGLLPVLIILMNLGAQKQKSQILRPCFGLCQVYAGYLCHHLWSETRQTGYSMGVTVRLESALNVVQKTQRAKERHWREPRDESILKKYPKPSR